MIHSYVSLCCCALGGSGREGPLVAVPAGYRLDAVACELDHVAFAGLVSQARDAHAAADSAAACEAYAKALGLWRGEPLADVDALREDPAVTRLSSLRAEAVTGYAEAAAAAGWHDRVLGDLRELVAQLADQLAHARLIIGAGRFAAQPGRRAGRLSRGTPPPRRAARDRARRRTGLCPCPSAAPGHPQGGGRPGAGNRGIQPSTRFAGFAAVGGAARAVGPGRRARQLPAGAAHFAGRSAELAELMRMVDPGMTASAALLRLVWARS